MARRAIAAARENGVRAAIAGGLAMQFYGSPRLTRDVDLIADGPPRDRAEFDIPEGIPVDWILRNDEYAPLYEETLDRSRPGPEGLLVVRPEHLAAMKFATLRARDYEDLMFLLGASGQLDLGAARRIVHARLGGKFALDPFEAAIEEARWRATTDRK